MKNYIFLLIIAALTCPKSYGQQRLTKISGNISYLSDNDTVIFYLYKYGRIIRTLVDDQELVVIYKAPVKNHRFQVSIKNLENRPYEFDIDLPKYLRVGGSPLLLEKGDNIVLLSPNTLSLSFGGHGAEKLNIIK